MLEKLEREKAVVLVVDLQEKLMPAIAGGEAVLAAAAKLLAGAGVLGVPVLASEQYPAGLGRTCAAVAELLGAGRPFEKMAFSSCTAEMRQGLAASGREQVIITGVEAHVCVQQTVLDLRRAGKAVWVCGDAIGSRKVMDRELAMQRMRDAGAIITSVESVLFEMLGEAGTDQFKRVLKILK